MSLALPSNMVIKKGDFAGVLAGYFLVTDTYAAKPVVGSEIIKRLNYLINAINVFHEDRTYKDAVNAELKSYGINPDVFVQYVIDNKQKILDAVGSYEIIKTLIADYAKLAKILKGGTVSEYIDHLAGQVKGGLMGLAGGIGDILANLTKHLLPVLLVIIVLFLVFVYGMGKINKSK